MLSIDFNKYPLPKRKRHHTHPNYYIPANELNVIPSGYPPLITTMDWSTIFVNQQPPDILDIGCGRGFFLLQLAEINKNKNVLGIEVRK